MQRKISDLDSDNEDIFSFEEENLFGEKNAKKADIPESNSSDEEEKSDSYQFYKLQGKHFKLPKTITPSAEMPIPKRNIELIELERMRRISSMSNLPHSAHKDTNKEKSQSLSEKTTSYQKENKSTSCNGK
jgi:hypothetical protein